MTKEIFLELLKDTIFENLRDWDPNDAETLGVIKGAMSMAEEIWDEVSE